MDVNYRIAARVSQLRRERKLSLEALAQRSGVSRSMISVVERGESSATATVLEKLAAGLDVTLAALFDDTSPPASPLVRHADQITWRDPQSGYQRRNVSPAATVTPIQLVEVVFPAGAQVLYDSTREVRVFHQVWMLEGVIEITLGDDLYRLEQGDCLAFELDRPNGYRNPTASPARYAVIMTSSRN